MRSLTTAARWVYRAAARTIWAELAALTMIAAGMGLWIFDPAGRALLTAGVLLELLVTAHDPERRNNGNNPRRAPQ